MKFITLKEAKNAADLVVIKANRIQKVFYRLVLENSISN